MLTVRVARVVMHVETQLPVALLEEVNGSRCMPVLLRSRQAAAIVAGLRGDRASCFAEDALASVLLTLGHRLGAVEIAGLDDEELFRAALVVDDRRVGLGPSQALAVAVREGLPIRIADELLEQFGQPIAAIQLDECDAPPEQQLADLRAFLDVVQPDDFRSPS